MNAFNRRSFLSAACAGGLATTFAPSLSFAQTATDRRFVFVLLGGAGRSGDGRSALHERCAKQAAGGGREEVERDRAGAGALPEDGDLGRVAPKLVDVGLDPHEGQVLVPEPHVAADQVVAK